MTGLGGYLEAHGGYLCRLEGFGLLDLPRLAARALREEGLDPACAGLQLSQLASRPVVRLAYDTPKLYGRQGARWYGEHHLLAQRLSQQLSVTVHAYVYDPEELERVVAFGDGRRVGGEALVYDEAEGLDDERLSEEGFARLQERWPLGHLARVLGLTRAELLSLPRAPSTLLDLAAALKAAPEAPEFALKATKAQRRSPARSGVVQQRGRVVRASEVLGPASGKS